MYGGGSELRVKGPGGGVEVIGDTVIGIFQN